MIVVKSGDLWSELIKLFNTKDNIQAAVAYVSDDSIVSFKKGDLLVVDASDASISGAKTSAEVLEEALKRGVKIFSCDTLHGKVIAFGQKAYIGSANISINSKEHLDEIGVISDDPRIIAGTVQVINDLAAKSIEVTEEFIKRISNIDVKRGGNSPKAKPRKVKIRNPRSWLLSLRNDADYPGDENKIDEENELTETEEKEVPAWFWMKKGSKFFDNAEVGDLIVIIERARKSDKTPKSAYRHFVIKNITLDGDIKAYHYAYTDNYAVTWSRFKKLATKSGITNLGSGLNTIRELSEQKSNMLFALWNIK